jgi:hypothetical protein
LPPGILCLHGDLGSYRLIRCGIWDVFTQSLSGAWAARRIGPAECRSPRPVSSPVSVPPRALWPSFDRATITRFLAWHFVSFRDSCPYFSERHSPTNHCNGIILPCERVFTVSACSVLYFVARKQNHHRFFFIFFFWSSLAIFFFFASSSLPATFRLLRAYMGIDLTVYPRQNFFLCSCSSSFLALCLNSSIFTFFCEFFHLSNRWFWLPLPCFFL